MYNQLLNLLSLHLFLNYFLCDGLFIIRDFNKYVKNDKQTEQIIIPLGDGLTVCRKL